MKYLISGILIVIIILGLMGTAYAGDISHYAMYKDYDTDRSYPLDISTNFTDSDRKIVSSLFLENMREEDAISWKYFFPNGNFYFEEKIYINWSGNGWVYNSNPVEKFLVSPGQWKVDIYINGVKKATDSFYVRKGVSTLYNLICVIILILLYLIIIKLLVLTPMKHVFSENKVSIWLKIYAVIWLLWSLLWSSISFIFLTPEMETPIFANMIIAIAVLLIFILLPFLPIYLAKSKQTS